VILKGFGMESSLSRYRAVDAASRAGLEDLCAHNTFTPDMQEVRCIKQKLAVLDHFRPQFCAIMGKKLASLVETRKSLLLAGKKATSKLKVKKYAVIYIPIL
jgi:hypothetical protein